MYKKKRELKQASTHHRKVLLTFRLHRYYMKKTKHSPRRDIHCTPKLTVNPVKALIC